MANGSGWYLKKGRSALIEISFQPYKSHFVVALLYIHFSKNESDFLYFLFIKTKLEQGIRELDIKYGKVCHKLSYNIVNSRQDAEECVNDAYLGAWNAIPPAKPNPLLTYICKIVRNISLKIYYRKEAAKRNSTYTIAMEEMEACIADPNTVEAEVDAYGFDTLGEYLPASLPDGYHFGKSDLYETTMKDGTVYYMLRVQYTTGYGTPQGSSGEEVAPDPNTLGNSLVVFIMNYKPEVKREIYEPTDITESKLEEIGGLTFHISYGDIYVGISPDTATTDDILVVVDSIK